MTLIIQKPTGAKLVLAKDFSFDTDASTYIEAVEGPTGDNQALETATRYAINDFVIGCKQDGIWSAIKASCILSGARTLAGALIPLAGTAPTNVGPFVSGDYNRKTGLKGDASTKYLNANRNHNVDPQNSRHMAAFATEKSGSVLRSLMGCAPGTSRSQIFLNTTSDIITNCADITNFTFTGSYTIGTGLIGISRSSGSNYQARAAQATVTASVTSVAPSSADIFIFNRSVSASLSSPRLAFYSIGESLDLALLDARVTDLINAFAAAIP
jgi:hypothetical protein